MFCKPILLSAAVAVASLTGLATSSARADVSFHLDINRPAPAAYVQRVWVEPVYETRCERVWIEPVYETRCDRVWHEPVYQDGCERVWVPDVYQDRVVITRDYHGRPYRHTERVLVTPGHYEDRPTHVLVQAGYFEDVQRQVCVTEGHWEEQNKQICVREGHWEEVAVAPAPRSGVEWHVDVRGDNDRGRWDGDRRDSGWDRHDDDRHVPAARRDDDRRPRNDQIGRDHDQYARNRDRDDRGGRYGR